MENHHSLESRVSALETRVAHLESVKGIVPHHAPAPHSPPVAVTAQENAISFENFIGSRVLLRAGVVALLLAVGFFLKYAFDQELLSDIAKIFIIALFGGVMIGIGEYFARKHPLFGHVIAGGGVAMWFFDVVAARTLYDVLSPTSALVAALLLTIGMLVYSVRRESQPLLIASLGGAYLAPIFFNASVDAPVHFEYGVYSLIVTLGAIWFLQRKEEWSGFIIVPIIGFGIHMMAWITNELPVALSSALVLIEFGVVLAVVSRLSARSAASATYATGIYVAQAFATFVLSLLVWGADISNTGYWASVVFSVAAAIASAATAWLYLRNSLHDVGDIVGFISVAYAFIAIALYFDRLWPVFVWLLLATVVSSLGVAMKRTIFSIAAMIVSGIAWVYFLAKDGAINARFYNLTSDWMNEFVLLFLFLIAVFMLQAYASKLHTAWTARKLGVMSFILAELTGLIFVLRQVSVTIDESYAYSIALILYGVANLGIGFARDSRPFRIAGLVTLVVAICKVAFIDLWNLGTLYRIAVASVLGALLIASSLLYHRYSDKTK